MGSIRARQVPEDGASTPTLQKSAETVLVSPNAKHARRPTSSSKGTTRAPTCSGAKSPTATAAATPTRRGPAPARASRRAPRRRPCAAWTTRRSPSTGSGSRGRRSSVASAPSTATGRTSLRGYSADGSRRRRGGDVDISWRRDRRRRGRDVKNPWRQGRGDAAAGTWIFHGDGVAATPRLGRGYFMETGSRRRRGCDVDNPWRPAYVSGTR